MGLWNLGNIINVKKVQNKEHLLHQFPRLQKVLKKSGVLSMMKGSRIQRCKSIPRILCFLERPNREAQFLPYFDLHRPLKGPKSSQIAILGIFFEYRHVTPRQKSVDLWIKKKLFLAYLDQTNLGQKEIKTGPSQKKKILTVLPKVLTEMGFPLANVMSQI